MIKGVHHIALKCMGVEAFEKTVQFYRDVLGLRVVRAWGEGEGSGIMLTTGDAMLEIFASGTDLPGQGAIRHFALATDDVDACVRAVEAAGYEVFIQPKDIVIASTPEFPARIAFCHGPVGEEIEFFQER
ncbi:MAG: VOC family protein [Candidatus Faecivicinus sp.]|nr:VOC family protein [Candidatus Faecivicinus sp.]